MSQVSAQVVVSAVVVWALQWAKQSKLVPWLTACTPKLNRAVAVLASLCAAAGVHWTFNGSEGVLVITGLTVSGIAHFLWHWLTSFVTQQLIFQTAVKPSLELEQNNPAPLAQKAAAGL